MGTFGCSQKFSCKTPISQTLCYCETLFCTAISKPTYGRNCAATQAIPSVVLGWSRAISAMLDTPHHGTLAHTILGIWYATLKKTQEDKSPENQTSVERFCNIQTIWVGLGGSRLQWIFSDMCKTKSNLQCGSTPEGLNIFLNSEVI